MTIILDFNDGV